MCIVFGIFVVVFFLSAVASSTFLLFGKLRCLLPPFEFELALMCVNLCVCVRVPCMLPVVWLFGRWRKPERKRHVCFCFQFIITRYFDDASGPSHHEKPVWCSMVCCVALHRIDNMSEWIWTALSNYRRFWSKSFLAIFGRVLHTNTHTHIEFISQRVSCSSFSSHRHSVKGNSASLGVNVKYFPLFNGHFALCSVFGENSELNDRSMLGKLDDD